MAFSNFLGNNGDGVMIAGDAGPGVTGPESISHTLADVPGNESTGF